MTSAQRFSGRTRALLACVLLGMVGLAIAVGTSRGVLAQGPPPGPGWVQVGGGWVPPDHPLALQGHPPVGTPGNPASCDVGTLNGSYIFAASGYNIVNGVAQPKAIVEGIDFNGNGTLSVPGVTVSNNGAISQFTSGAGFYTLGAGCRGTVTFTPGPSFDIYIDPTGRQGWMIQTNPNTVFQGTVTKIAP